MTYFFFFFSSRRRHTRLTCDWSSDVCSSDLVTVLDGGPGQDAFQFGQLFGAARTSPDRVAFGDEIETVQTTRGYLSRGISFPTTAYGGDDNDLFTVYSNKAPLKLFGEDG